MSFDPLTDLTRDGSFWDLRRLSGALHSKHSGRNWAAIIGTGAAAFLLAAGTGNADVGQLARDTSAAIFVFATTILGILIAGFAIFTTIASTDVAKTLAFLEHKGKDGIGTGMSTIKWMSLHFVRAFIRYIEFACVHCVVWFFGYKGGVASILAAAFTTPHIAFGKYAAAAVFGFLAGYMVLLVVELATFVFNVHAGFMAMVRGRIDPYGLRLVEIREQELKEEAAAEFAKVDAAAKAEIDAEDAAAAAVPVPAVRVSAAASGSAADAEAIPGMDDDDIEVSRRKSH